MTMRRALVKELAPLRRNAIEDHPWREWAGAAAESSRCPARRAAGAPARICRGAAARRERVCEVKYDHMQGDRFRHAVLFRAGARISRRACRYDQLEVTKPYELERIFSSGSSGS